MTIHSGKVRQTKYLLIIFSLLLATALLIPLLAHAANEPTPAPAPGGGGWDVKARIVCTVPVGKQPTCEFSGSVAETGNSDSALLASHNGLLEDAASALSATFTCTNVSMDDGNYSGLASIYDDHKHLVASKKIIFYVAGNTAYLANPSAVSSWLTANSSPGDSYETTATIPFHVTESNYTLGEVRVTARVNGYPVAGTTSKFDISGSGN